VVPDLAEDLPGRGMWVSASRDTLALALRRQAFARAARRPVKVPEDLVDRVAALLARRCLDLIGLARRAGRATTGFEKVREALAAGQVAVLLAAADGAADGRGKLRRMARGLPLIESFSSAELSLALGRENVIHAALAPGSLASRFQAEAARLAGFRRPPGSLEVAESESV
jgi:ribosomal protein L7Ae-like RNA K-turn-binding protein